MLRLLGKHPCFSLAVLLLGQAAFIAAAAVATAVRWTPGENSVWMGYGTPLWYAAFLTLPFACGFVVGLIRRRSGCKPWLLLLASALMAVLAYLPICVIGSMTALVVNWDGDGPDGPVGGREVYSFADLLGWSDQQGFYAIILALAAVGATLGVLTGWAVAVRLIRTGRWETIVPVQQPATNSG